MTGRHGGENTSMSKIRTDRQRSGQTHGDSGDTEINKDRQTGGRTVNWMDRQDMTRHSYCENCITIRRSERYLF